MLSTLRNAGPAAIRQAARPMAGRAMASKASDMGAYKHNYDAIIEQRAVAAKQELATLAEAFMRYDGDGNGHLDRDELVAASGVLGAGAAEVVLLPSGKVTVRSAEQDDSNTSATPSQSWSMPSSQISGAPG